MKKPEKQNPFIERAPLATLHDEARRAERLFPVAREIKGTHGGPVGRTGKKVAKS